MAHVVAYELVALVRIHFHRDAPCQNQVFTSLLVKLHEERAREREREKVKKNRREKVKSVAVLGRITFVLSLVDSFSRVLCYIYTGNSSLPSFS